MTAEVPESQRSLHACELALRPQPRIHPRREGLTLQACGESAPGFVKDVKADCWITDVRRYLDLDQHLQGFVAHDAVTLQGRASLLGGPFGR